MTLALTGARFVDATSDAIESGVIVVEGGPDGTPLKRVFGVFLTLVALNMIRKATGAF